MTLSRTLPLYACLAASLLLTGCGAGERLSNLNPFSAPESDDPNAPPDSERRSVLELGEPASDRLRRRRAPEQSQSLLRA